MKNAQEIEILRLRSENLRLANEVTILRRKVKASHTEEEYQQILSERNLYKSESQFKDRQIESQDRAIASLKEEIAIFKTRVTNLEEEREKIIKENSEFKDLAELMKKEDLDNKSVADMLKGLLYGHSSEKLDIEAAEMFGGLPEGQAALLAMAAGFVKETSGQLPKETIRHKRGRRTVFREKKGSKTRGPYRQYGVDILENIGIDTREMDSKAKVILRKQKEDKFSIQLLYVSPGKVYAKNYEIGRFYVPGIGQLNSNRPKDEFISGCPVSGSFASFYWSAKCQYNVSEQKILNLLHKMGCDVPQETLNDWMHKVADHIYAKLYPAIVSGIRSSHILNMDETRLCVRSEADGKLSYHTEYVHGALSMENRLFLMTYKEGSRSHDIPEEILSGSDVHIIMADRCIIYPKAIKDIGEGVVERGADWVHGRRYIRNAFKSDHRIKPLLEKVTRLFQLENLFQEQGLTPKQRLSQRLLISKLVVDSIFAELKAMKTEIHNYGKLVRWMVDYFLDDEQAFRTFLHHGELDIDNNAIERLFRHLAMGRRTWEHIGSHRAARNISFLYSLVESCKLNKIDFGDYLTYLLTHINDKDIDLKTLLPNRVDLPREDGFITGVA